MESISVQGRRIIFVQQSLEIGGAERQALHLACYLKTAGANVEYWGFGQPGAGSNLSEQYGIRWRSLPISWLGSKKQILRNIVRFAIILRKAHPDIVLPYTMPPNVFCGLTWRASGARICVWNQRDEGRQQIDRTLEHLAVKYSSIHVSNSQQGVNYLSEEHNLAPQDIHLIYNGVSMAPEVFNRSTWRARLQVSEDAVIATMVANLHHFKDHNTLLKAWGKVIEAGKKTGLQPLLVLAGRDDGKGAELKGLAYDLGICANVKFVGAVQDITGLLTASDIGVFSSVTEGCPNGVLECMRMGLPVVGTDIIGIREALGDANMKYLVASFNSEMLASKLITLIADPVQRNTVGQFNAKRIGEHFSVARMCNSMVRLIS